MNLERLIARARNVTLAPKTEWPVIAGESDTVGGIYKGYILLLAAIPAVAGFLKSVVIGTSVPMVGTVRVGVMSGLAGMIFQYVIGLAVVYVLALIVEALAPSFGGQKDRMQALKATAYASTASWLAGGLVIVPWLGWILALAGGIYSIYLLYLGLPVTMRSPPEKAAGYTAVTVVCAVVMSMVLGAVTGTLVGLGGSRGGDVTISSGDGSVTIDADSAAGKLDAWAKKMEAAGKKMEAAQKSGDTQAQQQAAAEAMGTMFGGGDTVEALKPEQLKGFVPETLGGLPRSDFSAERNTMMGVQVAETKARYHDESGEHSLELEITDLGGAKGIATLAGFAVQESERESDTGYDKVYRQDGRMVHEEWNTGTGSGTYGLLIGERFAVKLHGQGFSMDELKEFAGTLDLSGLEALKKSGVKPS